VVIDLDAIATEMGLGRDRSGEAVTALLEERNHRLATLSNAHPNRTAFVIVTAASEAVRDWWQQTLGVKEWDVILLIPSRNELSRRIKADPERNHERQLQLVDEWFEREAKNDPGVISSGCDENGIPTDRLHPWRTT
jgi:hypothetical protein